MSQHKLYVLFKMNDTGTIVDVHISACHLEAQRQLIQLEYYDLLMMLHHLTSVFGPYDGLDDEIYEFAKLVIGNVKDVNLEKQKSYIDQAASIVYNRSFYDFTGKATVYHKSWYQTIIQ